MGNIRREPHLRSLRGGDENIKEMTASRPSLVARGTDRRGAISVMNDRLRTNEGVMNPNAGMYDWKDLIGPNGQNLTRKLENHEVSQWPLDQAMESGSSQSDAMRPDGWNLTNGTG